MLVSLEDDLLTFSLVDNFRMRIGRIPMNKPQVVSPIICGRAISLGPVTNLIRRNYPKKDLTGDYIATVVDGSKIVVDLRSKILGEYV